MPTGGRGSVGTVNCSGSAAAVRCSLCLWGCVWGGWSKRVGVGGASYRIDNDGYIRTHTRPYTQQLFSPQQKKTYPRPRNQVRHAVRHKAAPGPSARLLVLLVRVRAVCICMWDDAGESTPTLMYIPTHVHTPQGQHTTHKTRKKTHSRPNADVVTACGCAGACGCSPSPSAALSLPCWVGG